MKIHLRKKAESVFRKNQNIFCRTNREAHCQKRFGLYDNTLISLGKDWPHQLSVLPRLSFWSKQWKVKEETK